VSVAFPPVDMRNARADDSAVDNSCEQSRVNTAGRGLYFCVRQITHHLIFTYQLCQGKERPFKVCRRDKRGPWEQMQLPAKPRRRSARYT